MKNRLVLGLTLILTAAYLISGVFNRSIVPVSITKVSAQEKAAKDSPPSVSSNGRAEFINKIPMKNLPLKIEIKNAEKEDFLHELTLIVTNTGDKPIYYLDFFVTAGHLKGTVPPLSFTLRFGGNVLGDLDKLAGEKDTPLLKGENVVLKIPEYQIKYFNEDIANGYRAKPEVFELWFGALNFGDGTGFHTLNAVPYPEKSSDSITQKPGNLLSISNKPRGQPACQQKSQSLSILQFDDYSPITLLFNPNSSNNPTDLSSQQVSGCCTGSCQKMKSYQTGGCNAGKGDPNEMRTLYTVANFCNEIGYACSIATARKVPCMNGSEIWTWTVNICGLEDDTGCTNPTGHEEGAPGYEYECSDGINNDCDAQNKNDCSAPNCVSDERCENVCDQDQDGETAQACGGIDCDDTDPTVPTRNSSGIPGSTPGPPYEFIFLCSDGKDNDCDGTADTNGTSIYPPDTDCATPDPTPTPSPTPSGGGGCLAEGKSPADLKKGEINGLRDNGCSCVDPQMALDCYDSGGRIDPTTCQCTMSPIVIDVSGNGYNLTKAAAGVRFDLNGDGQSEQIAWTAAASDDAWLALDRDGNGLIDNGKELFGNKTHQSAPPAREKRNGFLALAEYDKLMNGGNNDGQITRQDAVFGNLRLWRDANHNGASEGSELKTLTQSGLAKIELDYQESNRTDEFGNQFRYRAKVRDAQGAQIGRWAWDVYLVIAPR